MTQASGGGLPPKVSVPNQRVAPDVLASEGRQQAASNNSRQAAANRQQQSTPTANSRTPITSDKAALAARSLTAGQVQFVAPPVTQNAGSADTRRLIEQALAKHHESPTSILSSSVMASFLDTDFDAEFEDDPELELALAGIDPDAMALAGRSAQV